MRKMSVLLSLFFVLTLLLSACGQASPTPTTVPTQTEPPAPTLVSTPVATAASGEEPLYLSIIWHQHQPLYYKDEEGIYTRPWVRVHATKDYYDMAAMLTQYPDVQVTINLTPVLIRQLNDFVQNGAKDRYWVLAEKPAADLTFDEKNFILRRFFDANWDHIIRVYPGYKALLDLRGEADDAAISAALQNFTEQDLRDLQVWFNLAWIDPDELAKEPLNSLVEKDSGFSEADKEVLFNEIRRIMAEIIPVHKELQDSGQIEVITTPYAHPILPLIYDSNLASVGNPSAELPEGRLFYPQDAQAHLEKAVEIYIENFGQAPRGLWPGEGAVAQEIVPLVANAGFEWMATGEDVLAKSLDIDNFTRDSSETVQQADQLYRPYTVQGKAGGPIDGGPVSIIFRDLVISDKLGFTYSGMAGEAAAGDVMKRLENIRQELIKEGGQGPHLVSIILDGENAWENYDNDGKAFLNALYQNLSESTTVKTITPSAYLAMVTEQETLETLFPAAWFSPNYDTWIGEPEETSAWNYLLRTRQALDGAVRSGKVSDEDLQTARDFMYLAEGSDWFWWYGSDQDSGADDYFDTGYRALLGSVYSSLGIDAPDFIQVPITQVRSVAAATPLQGLSTPVIDGAAGEVEWANAAAYPAEGQSPSTGFAYTLDKKNLYIKMTFGESLLPVQRVGFYFNTPQVKGEYHFDRTIATEPRMLLQLPANILVEWDGSPELKLFEAGSNGWEPAGSLGQTAAANDTREFAIPLEVLGEIEAGDEIRFVIGVEPANQFLPALGPAQIMMPELTTANILLEVQDPQGDDNGPGTYTYPTNSTFLPDAYDLKTFTVAADENNLIFKFAFFGGIPNPWGSGNNLAIQTLDVYIDKDPGGKSGARLLLPGRNAALTSENGWEYAIWAEGWNPGIFAPDATTLEPKPVDGANFKILVDTAAQSVTLRVPRATFGEGDPSSWGYAAAVLGQDGFPATGVWRVRDVNPEAGEFRFGGGPADATHTRIIDLAWAEGAIPGQDEMLSKYTSSSASMESLSPDDFAQIELIKK